MKVDARRGHLHCPRELGVSARWAGDHTLHAQFGRAKLPRIAGDLETRLYDAVEKADELDATSLLAALFPGVPSMIETPVQFACTCSHERAMTTLESLGATEVQTIVDTLGSTAVTCQFCGTKHEISLKDLWEILERLGHPPHRN